MHIWWLLLLFVICQLSTVQNGYAALSCPTQTAVCHFTLCSESRLIADGMLHTLHQQRQQQKLIKNHKLLSDREFDRIRNVIRCDRSHEKKKLAMSLKWHSRRGGHEPSMRITDYGEHRKHRKRARVYNNFIYPFIPINFLCVSLPTIFRTKESPLIGIMCIAFILSINRRRRYQFCTSPHVEFHSNIHLHFDVSVNWNIELRPKNRSNQWKIFTKTFKARHRNDTCKHHIRSSHLSPGLAY